MMRHSLFAVGLATVAACGPSDRGSGGTGTDVDAAVQPGVDAFVSTADAASCDACDVTAPNGSFCGIQVAITPYVANGGPFGGFQSQTGTGQSELITISLTPAINWVSVKVLDPDFAGNFVRAYDTNNTMVSEFTVAGDGTANVLTEEMGGTGGTGIVRVELVPALGDYVAYDKLQVVPAGCAPIL